MPNRSVLRRATRAAACVGVLVAPAQALAHGAVFTETNQASGNAVAVFARANDGSLTPVAQYSTGGVGTGTGLGSQGALAASQEWLVAVDAGSNDVAAFRVDGRSLRLVNRVDSGGVKPVSVTIHGRLVYVLNTGGAGNITGFRLTRHGLVAVNDATQPLSSPTAGAVEVSFTRSGDQLVVSEKAANTIETFPVSEDGRAGAGTAHASAGPAPFGFSAGRHGALFFSEAKNSALSSYTTAGGGFAVITASLVNGQGAACWTALTHDGRFVYTANAATDSISGYAVAGDGSVTLVTPGGATAQLAAGTHPLDEAISRNDQYLYVNGANAHVIDALAINADGSLRPVGAFGALPAGNAGLIAQ